MAIHEDPNSPQRSDSHGMVIQEDPNPPQRSGDDRIENQGEPNSSQRSGAVGMENQGHPNPSQSQRSSTGTRTRRPRRRPVLEEETRKRLEDSANQESEHRKRRRLSEGQSQTSAFAQQPSRGPPDPSESTERVEPSNAVAAPQEQQSIVRELVNSYQWAVLTLRSRAHYGDNQAADALWDLISAMEALASSPQESPYMQAKQQQHFQQQQQFLVQQFFQEQQQQLQQQLYFQQQQHIQQQHHFQQQQPPAQQVRQPQLQQQDFQQQQPPAQQVRQLQHQQPGQLHLHRIPQQQQMHMQMPANPTQTPANPTQPAVTVAAGINAGTLPPTPIAQRMPAPPHAAGLPPRRSGSQSHSSSQQPQQNRTQQSTQQQSEKNAEGSS